MATTISAFKGRKLWKFPKKDDVKLCSEIKKKTIHTIRYFIMELKNKEIVNTQMWGKCTIGRICWSRIIKHLFNYL